MRFAIVTAAALIFCGLARGQDTPPPPPPPAPPGAGQDEFFARNDTDKDGKVTKAELEANAKKTLEAADADKDGKVTPDELRNGQLSERFTRLDINHDGGVDLTELQSGRGGGRGMGGRGMGGGMGRDQDQDGFISVEELTQGMSMIIERAGVARAEPRLEVLGEVVHRMGDPARPTS